MSGRVSIWPDDLATDHGDSARPREQVTQSPSPPDPGASAPACAPHRQPASRVLVLHQRRDPGSHFLESVVERCRALEATPVVLSVAWSENEARLRQRFAEETFARLGQPAEFDLAAGCGVRTAVACAARLRGCTHVFVEAPDALPWWRRPWGDARRRLLGRLGPLTVLTIPGTPVEGPAEKQRGREYDS
jgi:hypothetical protein